MPSFLSFGHRRNSFSNCRYSTGYKRGTGKLSRCRGAVYRKSSKLRHVKNERGIALITFLLALIPITFLVFSPIFYGQQMDTHDKAKAQMYAYLDRVQLEGYLTVQDELQMYEAFEKIGAPIVNVEGPRESQGAPRILRSNNVNDSLITMKITCRPETKGLKIGSLVGATDSDGYYIYLKGSVISERVTP